MKRVPRDDVAIAARIAVGIVAVALLGLAIGFVGASELGSVHEHNETTPFATDDGLLTERLLLPTSNATTASDAPGVNPGRSTSLAFDRLEAEYDAHLLDARVQNTTGSGDQLAHVRDDLEVVEAQLERAHERERAAYEAFAEGEITAHELLVEFATLHEQAQILEFRLDRHADAIRMISPMDENVTIVRGEIAQLKLEASTFKGPVREEVLESMTGETRIDRPITVQAAPDGYVLGTVQDGVFLREAYVATNRDRLAGGSFSSAEAGRERAAELYPWTFEEAVGIQDLLRGGTYRASIDHQHGTTTMFVDGTTDFAFREFQQLDLFTLTPVEANATVEDGFDVALERTHASGPARVVLERGDEPVSGASVIVDGQYVGETDRNGMAWFLAAETDATVQIVFEDVEFVLEMDVPLGEPTAP